MDVVAVGGLPRGGVADARQGLRAQKVQRGAAIRREEAGYTAYVRDADLDDANADRALGASASYTKARAELHAACWQEGGVDKKGRKQHLFTFDRHPAAFIRVGGSFLWQAFLTKVGERTGSRGE